jgi:hypothetical protein
MRLLGLLILLLVVAGCGADEFAELEPKNPSRAAEGLVFTRSDGSSYEIKDAVAKCIEHRTLPGVKVVRLVAPANRRQSLGSDGKEPVLVVDVALGVQGTMKLPLQERDYDTGPSDVVVFGADPERHNELSGTVEEASGEVTVLEATCDPEPRLSVAVDATLGSEIGQPKVQVEGGLASMLPG